MKLKKPRIVVLFILNSMVRCFQHNSTKVESIKMTFSGFSDLIQSRYGDGGLSNDNSDQVIKQKLAKEGFNATV